MDSFRPFLSGYQNEQPSLRTRALTNSTNISSPSSLATQDQINDSWALWTTPSEMESTSSVHSTKDSGTSTPTTPYVDYGPCSGTHGSCDPCCMAPCPVASTSTAPQQDIQPMGKNSCCHPMDTTHGCHSMTQGCHPMDTTHGCHSIGPTHGCHPIHVPVAAHSGTSGYLDACCNYPAGIDCTSNVCMEASQICQFDPCTQDSCVPGSCHANPPPFVSMCEEASCQKAGGHPPLAWHTVECKEEHCNGAVDHNEADKDPLHSCTNVCDGVLLSDSTHAKMGTNGDQQADLAALQKFIECCCCSFDSHNDHTTGASHCHPSHHHQLSGFELECNGGNYRHHCAPSGQSPYNDLQTVAFPAPSDPASLEGLWEACNVHSCAVPEMNTTDASAIHMSQHHHEHHHCGNKTSHDHHQPQQQQYTEYLKRRQDPCCDSDSGAKRMRRDVISVKSETGIRHGRSNVSAGNTVHICRWLGCSKVFPSDGALHDHIVEDHIGSKKSTYECLWQGCTRGHRVFDQKQKIKRHMQTHTGEYCDKKPGS